MIRLLNDALLNTGFGETTDLILPKFDHKGLKPSIVHFGPGAFHRAHQAYYFELLNNAGGDYGITEISLNSRDTIDKLKAQDFLYTITELSENGKVRVIGSVINALFAPDNPQQILRLLADVETKIITSTITEKGYCLNNDNILDLAHPDIMHDIANPNAPKSYIGYVTYGLWARFKNNIPPFTIIPCDNLAENGRLVRGAIIKFAQQIDNDFAEYLEKNLVVPSTMVDSITPKSDDDLFKNLEDKYSLVDNAAVWREEFVQWVIEDIVNQGYGIKWENAGIIITPDVAAYENVKLRILNGAHSTLAYLGYLCGYQTVAQALNSPEIEQIIKNLIYKNIIPSLYDVKNVNLEKYADDILARFKNKSVAHQLSQIAWDGSKKIPYRLLPSIRKNLANGNFDISYLAIGIAAWIRFIIKMSRNGLKIMDPLANKLSKTAQSARDNANDILPFLEINEIFDTELGGNKTFVAKTFTDSVKDAYLKIIKIETEENFGQIIETESGL